MPLPKRRTWLAFVVGTLGLVGLLLASLIAEPYLIALAIGPQVTEPRSSAAGWANGTVWLASVAVTFFALFVCGYLTKRLSPLRSWLPFAVLLVAVFAYAFFAQFPATRSVFRITLWSVGLPASVAFGAWLAHRAENDA